MHRRRTYCFFFFPVLETGVCSRLVCFCVIFLRTAMLASFRPSGGNFVDMPRTSLFRFCGDGDTLGCGATSYVSPISFVHGLLLLLGVGKKPVQKCRDTSPLLVVVRCNGETFGGGVIIFYLYPLTPCLRFSLWFSMGDMNWPPSDRWKRCMLRFHDKVANGPDAFTADSVFETCPPTPCWRFFFFFLCLCLCAA